MRDCQQCGKPLKQATLNNGKRVWVCKKPTCKAYMKPA